MHDTKLYIHQWWHPSSSITIRRDRQMGVFDTQQYALKTAPYLCAATMWNEWKHAASIIITINTTGITVLTHAPWMRLHLWFVHSCDDCNPRAIPTCDESHVGTVFLSFLRVYERESATVANNSILKWKRLWLEKFCASHRQTTVYYVQLYSWTAFKKLSWGT